MEEEPAGEEGAPPASPDGAPPGGEASTTAPFPEGATWRQWPDPIGLWVAAAAEYEWRPGAPAFTA
eukprot:15383244-Alexandrium_andersonii.AAC.1